MGGIHNIVMNKEYRMGIASFDKFSEIQNKIRTCDNTNIKIDCTATKYISPAFASLFGSLPHYGLMYGKRVTITYNPKNGERYIKDIGIDKYYTSSGKPSKKAVPFSSLNWEEYEHDSMDGIDKILNQLPIILSPSEQGVLISILGEIFNNAKDHSGFQNNKHIRVYYCGYWNAKRDNYTVSIYDTGVGITSNVSNYLKKDLDDIDALQWAFGDGNSTRNFSVLDYTRGIGLNSLENFIKANNGNLFVGSGASLCSVRNGDKSFHTLKHSLHGTMYVFTVHIGEKRKFMI